MRYLIDTNIFIYLATDPDLLSEDVKAIIMEYDNSLYISAESVKELIVAYSKKRFGLKRWKSTIEMVKAITDEFFITVLPVDNEVMKTYATLEINKAEEHNDPSDHVIISQAITLKLPLISSDRKFWFYQKQGLDLIFNKK